MEASILDLRYKMKEVLRSLERGEAVVILYHGKQKGILYPWKKVEKKAIKDHPFFGMMSDEKEPVDQVMETTRSL